MHKLLTKDTVIVFDLETTGFVAGVNSILSIGAVAYRLGEEIACFYACLKEWEGAERNEGCMQWWNEHLDEWKAVRKDAEDPQVVMQRFYDWVCDLPKPNILAANPAAMDAGMMFYYLHKYCGEKAVEKLFKRYRCLDIRTVISILFAVPYSDAERYVVPAEWSDGHAITHNALDDARETGAVLMNLLRESVGEQSTTASA